MAKNRIELLIQAKDKASAQFKKVEVATQEMRAGVMLAGKALLAAGAAMGAVAVRAASVGDKFDKMSQRVATSTKNLSQLEFAVKQSGGNIEQLEGGLRVLNRNMSETAKGTGAAKDFFKALGIEVKGADGKLRSNVDVMKEVADTISNMTDRTQAAALASRILGEEYGARLVPLLNNGSDGIEKLMNQADDLGVTITKDSALIGAGFTDALGEATTATSGLFQTLGVKLIPIIEPLVDAFTMAISKTTKWINENESLSDTLKNIGGFVGFLVNPMNDFQKSLAKMGDKKAAETLGEIEEKMKRINENRKKGGQFSSLQEQKDYELMQKKVPLLQEELAKRKAIAENAKKQAGINAKILKLQAALIATGGKKSENDDKEISKEDEKLQAFLKAAEARQKKREEDAAFFLQQEEEEEAREAEKEAKEEEARQEKEDKEKALAERQEEFQLNALGGISNAIAAFGGENSKAYKAFASMQVVVSTAAAIMKGFADLGPIWGAVNAGTMTALGAAQIAKINGAKFHDGGLVPGAGETPAILEGGEFVMRREAVQNIGANNLAQMNQGKGSNVNVVNFVDSDALDNYLNSHKGQKAIVNALEFA
tara:strand:- start:6087 stop:7883 length:1797 start_codon:yes stop_codon:yes gene_type:complete